MDKNPIIIGRLIALYHKGDISDDELNYLRKLMDEDDSIRLIIEKYKSEENYKQDIEYLGQIDSISAWDQIVLKSNEKSEIKRNNRTFLWIGLVAASLVLITFWVNNIPSKDDRIIQDQLFGFKNDILPGKQQAELVLSNGKTIKLDEFKENGNTGISTLHSLSTLKHDKLALQSSVEEQEHLFQTLRVPEASTYKIELPDGTTVKLNSSSSLTYPIRFSNSKREVQIEGEAYFEVAKQINKPFIVNAPQGKVQVLGTVFNVNTYKGGTTFISLIEGSVRISNEFQNNTLVPGELAALDVNNISKTEIDLEKFIAWNEDYFFFKNDSVHEIMAQIARWYGVEVKYKSKVSNKTYGGSISRKVTLAEALTMLTKVSGLSFEIDEKKVFVNVKTQYKKPM